MTRFDVLPASARAILRAAYPRRAHFPTTRQHRLYVRAHDLYCVV